MTNIGESPRSTGTIASTEDQLVEQVRAVWAEVLDLGDPASVGLDDNFLEFGGTSLLLIMLWEDLHRLTPRPLRVSDLFLHATVRAQAALLAGVDEPRPHPSIGASRRRQLLGRARRVPSATDPGRQS